MKFVKHAGFMVVVALAAVLALAGCNSNVSAPSSSSEETLTGGVAATVNGNEIMEDEITRFIQSWRNANGLAEQDAWGNYLASINDDPAMFREEIIDYFISQILVTQACEERGIELTDEEVDDAVERMRANYDDDEAWTAALTQAGTTEEDYRESVKNGLLEQRLQEAVVDESDTSVSDEDMLDAAQMYASYIDGSRRSSHILFNLDDKETAERVLEQLKNGEITFEDAVSEYSVDPGSAEQDGDVGWDRINSFVTEYSEGLEKLAEGEMSDLVESQYGYHIIKCTEIYTAPEDGVTSLDQIPEDLVNIIRSELESSAETSAVSEWYTEYKEAADIVINEMPEGLPYYVDMENYNTEDESTDDGSLELETIPEDAEAEADAEADVEAEVEAGAEDGAADAEAAADGADEAEANVDAADAADADVEAEGANEQPAEISSEAEARSSEAA